MEQNQNSDNTADILINEYLNAKADVELGVRLDQHLLYINETLDRIDLSLKKHIENPDSKGSLEGFFELGYLLYKLRDNIGAQLSSKIWSEVESK